MFWSSKDIDAKVRRLPLQSRFIPSCSGRVIQFSKKKFKNVDASTTAVTENFKVKKRLIVADKLSGGMLAQRLSAVYNSAKISCYKSELLIQCYKNQNISLHCVEKNLGVIK